MRGRARKMHAQVWRWWVRSRRVEALLHGARLRLTAGRDIAIAKIAGWRRRSKGGCLSGKQRY
ncbi:hypothetical protein BwSH20_68970 [Bradyrhizobium ottawaense]|nr:hypothetical protein SG09_18060 [Bradyrhizobium ottawaense]GMO48780.1 hypothetical protein BwSF21_68060 [Bradyrhizobium ottawaense]GMO56195.1 hypothetical protein BwSF12_71750 [Bradyrhizobium ottawaense]GMO72923.1 hypothetical protein BwSG20_40400 [Bradyrhizobium ottawaense]GMO78125.1 hypothetical protein BwSG10_46620 [Bradyrhizobium ottawaense]